MNCYVCGEPATGQCQSCWKFYCGNHGDIYCEQCPRQQAGQRSSPGFQGLMDAQRALAQQPDAATPPHLRGVMEATTLERVVPVAQTKTCGTDEMTLLSLELYNDGLILHWRLRAPAEHAGPAMFGGLKLMAFTGNDDRANTYAGVPAASAGIGGWGEARLTPSVDPQATRMTIRAEELTISNIDGQDVILLGADGRPFDPTNSPVQFGPWEFEVEL